MCVLDYAFTAVCGRARVVSVVAATVECVAMCTANRRNSGPRVSCVVMCGVCGVVWDSVRLCGVVGIVRGLCWVVRGCVVECAVVWWL